MKKLTVEQIVNITDRLRGERGTFETHWQEVADYFIPNKAQITTKKYPGQQDAFQLLDNVGVHSNELLAGALHGLLTNTDAPWFEFTTGKLDLDNDDEIRMYFQQSVRVMHNVLSNSNFYVELHEMYLEMPSIGTGCFLTEEDDKDYVRFSAKPITDYLIDEDRRGNVNQVYNVYKCTARELITEFGKDKLPEKVVKCKNEGEKFCVIHAVYLENVADPVKGTTKIVSQYVLPELKHEISQGQFHEMPFSTPRFYKRTGEKYGRSPAMTALPEMRVLNKMNQTMLIGMQKQVDPPLQVEDDGVILPLVTRPGGINYRRAGSEPIAPLFTGTRIDIAYQSLADRRQRIRDAFYVDQLRLSQDMKYMSATEVLQRTEDALRLLGPLIGRMQREFLRPVIDRVFRICLDRGLLPPIPKKMSGMKFDVRYSSTIAKAQRVAEGQGIMRTIEAIAPFMQMDPAVADHFNGDAAVRFIAGLNSFPQEVLNSAAKIQAIRQGRSEAQQNAVASQQAAISEEMQVQQTATLAKAQKDLNAAST